MVGLRIYFLHSDEMTGRELLEVCSGFRDAAPHGLGAHLPFYISIFVPCSQTERRVSHRSDLFEQLV